MKAKQYTDQESLELKGSPPPKSGILSQEFTATAILAYECGYAENLVRDEVEAIGGAALGKDMQEARPRISASLDARPYEYVKVFRREH